MSIRHFLLVAGFQPALWSGRQAGSPLTPRGMWRSDSLLDVIRVSRPDELATAGAGGFPAVEHLIGIRQPGDLPAQRFRPHRDRLVSAPVHDAADRIRRLIDVPLR